MRDVNSSGDKGNVEVVAVRDDRNFKSAVSADELATSGVRGKLEKIRHIYKGGGEAVPTSLLEVGDLSGGVIETKRDNAKVLDRTNDLIVVLDESCTLERSVCDKVKKAKARINALEKHVAASDAKYSKTVEEPPQVNGELRTRNTSLVSELKA